jgi:hypothetical protein
MAVADSAWEAVLAYLVVLAVTVATLLVLRKVWP